MDKTVKESTKKGLAINGKKTEYVVVSKRDNLRREQCIKGIKTKRVQKMNYTGNVVRDNEKYNTGI